MGKRTNIKVFHGSKAGQVTQLYVNDKPLKRVSRNKRLSPEEMDQRKKSCDGKVKHKSLLAANEYLYNSKENLEVYPCKFCGGFHLGHPNNKTI